MSDNSNLPKVIMDYIARSIQVQIDEQKPWAAMHFLDNESIRGMAYLYTHADSPMKGAAKLADEIRSVYKYITTTGIEDSRQAYHVAEAWRLLKTTSLADLMPNAEKLLTTFGDEWMKKLHLFKHITHFTSANLDTSTNHVAQYGTAVYCVGRLLQREDYMQLARNTWERLTEDQHPDGYWAETTGGPAVIYNYLTFTCAGRMARWTGDQRMADAAQRAAKFHRRFSYPDTCEMETFDGRNRYGSTPMMWGGFVHSATPEGRAYAERKLAVKMKLNPVIPFGKQGGEDTALLAEDHEFWIPGPAANLELARTNYVEQLREPGAVRRQGPWFISLQGLLALPRGRGNFTIDRTSLLSVWHEKHGLIVNGSGEPDANAGQSFKFRTAYEVIKYAIPERTTLSMGAAGSSEPAKILAEYPGGTAHLSVHFVSDKELRFDISVATRTDRYPIPFTLQLELRDGDVANGTTLGTEQVEWSAADLKGNLETKKFSLSFPEAGAAFRWPYDPYYPYDVVNKRSPRSAYVSLLHMPVGPEGIQIRLKV